MNPLKLDARNRKFYEALVDLHYADTQDKEDWLAKYRRVKRIKELEGPSVIPAFRIFFVKYNNWCPVEFAVKMTFYAKRRR